MPALPFALAAFAAGVVLLQWQPVLPSAALWFSVASGMALLAIALSSAAEGRPAARSIATTLLIAATAALGFAYAAWRADLRLADALAPEWEGQDIALCGVIDDIPKVSPRGARFTLAVEGVETAGAKVPPRISLSWYAQAHKDGTSDDVPELIAGERWSLTVRLKRPHGTVNPHGFDVEAWLLENGLRATGYVRANPANARVDAFAGRPGDYVERSRTAVRDRITAALGHAPYTGVIVALAIGEERAIPDAQWRVFNRTGITHLISISGLHVTVFAALAGGMGFAVARRCVRLTTRLPARKVAAAVGVLAATLYVLLAGAQVPAVRTLVMLQVAAFGLWLARPGTAGVVWLWALVAVLAWDPWAGFSPGFWLSFGAVGLLLYAHAGRLPPSVPPTRAARALAALRAAARTQALVTIGLVPGTLAIFQQVSLVSPIANAIAIPVVTFLVVPLALAGIVLPFDFPWQAAHAVFATLMTALDALANAPAAVWQQHAPPAWTIGAALAGIAWLAAPRGVPGRGVGVVALLPLFVVTPVAPAPGTFRLTVLDVGQGLAVTVSTHRHALLYDTGPRYHEDADAGGRIVAPYLRAAGIAHLDAMIVTHQDSDHSGGALSVLAAVPVDWLASSLPDDHAILAQRASDRGATQRCEAGQRWEWDGVHFAVLQPGPQHYANPHLKPNDLSCVVRIESAFGTVLLTGDLEARGELELVRADPELLKADLLIVPHHGSLTSSTPDFIAAVAPEIAVYTPGYRNRFGHPRAEVVARYAAAGVRTYRTDFDGALAFTFAPDTPRAPARRAQCRSAILARRAGTRTRARAGSDAATRRASHRLSTMGPHHAFVVCLARMLLFAACGLTLTPRVMAQPAKTAPTELKLSVAVGPAFALGKAARTWANAIGEGSHGTLAVVLYPGATLSQRDPAREFTALHDGVADLAVGSTLYWSAQVNALAVVGLPWIAAESAELAALTQGEAGDALSAAVLRAGAVPLALAPLGHRAIATTTRSVRTPGDVAGLAIRITSTPYLVELYAGLRGQPNAVPFAEADAAFRSGALNAQEGTVATFAAARVDALGFKDITLWGAVGEVAVFAVNATTWARLDAVQQAALKESAQSAAEDLAQTAAADEQAAIGLLRSRGVAILRLTPSGRAAFAAAARPVYDRWAAVAGESVVRTAEAAVSATLR